MTNTCSFENCNKPASDYIIVPDHSGNRAGLCETHNGLEPLYYNYLTCKFTATKGNGTEQMYAPPCPDRVTDATAT